MSNVVAFPDLDQPKYYMVGRRWFPTFGTEETWQRNRSLLLEYEDGNFFRGAEI
jgi:hypothetical protein